MTAAAATTAATTCNCDSRSCYDCLLEVATNPCNGTDFDMRVFIACLTKYSKANQCFSK
uniref:Uncharacterized protein n=1 Tax=Oryza punctata TaxID=4537 RepID=A0A0E0LU78_ORYPU